MAGGPIGGVFGDRSEIVWSSGRIWAGLTLERIVHETIDTPEFVMESHCVLLHVAAIAYVEHKIDGSRRRFLHEPGNISLLSAGVPRQIRSRTPHTVLALAIAPALIDCAVEPDVAPAFRLIENYDLRDGRIEHIVRALELEALEGYPSGPLYGEALGLALAIHLAQQYATSPFPTRDCKGGMAPRSLRRVVDYVDAHLKDELKLRDLAAVAGLSKHRFAHNFKTTTGLSPHRYVLAQKIARAKRMLREDGSSVTEIAFALGFTQISRFSAVFHRWTGVTPSTYRRAAE